MRLSRKWRRPTCPSSRFESMANGGQRRGDRLNRRRQARNSADFLAYLLWETVRVNRFITLS
jgi:hypothetical protein